MKTMDLRSRCRRGARRFGLSSSAASMPEYAIMLLVIMALAMLSVELLGNLSQGVYQQVGDNLGAAPAGQVELAERRGDDRSSPRMNLARSQNLYRWGRVIALVAFTLLVLGALRLLRRKRADTAAEPKALQAEPVKSDSENVFQKRQLILRILSNDVDALMDGTLEVRHLMTRNPITIKPGQSVQDGVSLMEQSHMDHLLVCEEDKTLVGLVSKFYLRRTNAKTIRQAMKAQPLFVAPDALLNPTVTQMINQGVSCVAVAERGRAVGILTTIDVQLTLQCALQLLFKATADKACDDRASVLDTTFGLGPSVPI